MCFFVVAKTNAIIMYTEYLKHKGLERNGLSNTAKYFIDSLINEAKQRDRRKVLLSDDCKQIKIVPIDNSDEHYLILEVNDDLSVNVLEHSLPDAENKLFPVCGNIESYTTIFFNYLEQMEDFYRQMNTIDQLCFIVDPVEITTKCNYRVLKIAEKVFMKMTIDPLLPSTVATTFYGPTSMVEHYRNLYRESLDEWNQNDEIHRNLLKIFEIVAFPQKSSQDETSSCSICYSYRCENQIPIITCDNDKCNLIYHAACLKRWFSTIRNTRTFLTVTSGFCPSCKSKLSTSFVQLLEQ